MKNKIYVDIHGNETIVAIVKGGRVVEIDVDNDATQNIVGNIYKGRVENVIPGIQAAFVSIGLHKNAYLFTGENFETAKENIAERTYNPLLKNLRVGDVLMVQVAKEQFGTKGVRITTNITLPGHLLVMTPYNYNVSVSQKITDESERLRLTGIAERNKKADAGYIIRTAACGADESAIVREMDELYKRYEGIEAVYPDAQESELVYEESDIISRMIRDMITDETEEIAVNDPVAYARIKRNLCSSGNRPTITLTTDKQIFDDIDLATQLENSLKRKVELDNGAYLIIDRTEALTVIDVNTGRFIGGSNLEETVYNTNLVAADEIARQLRLRNIGGIIIIDFIDMDEAAHGEAVVERLKEALKDDRIKTAVLGMTPLGLVELTRKKKRGAVADVFTQPCPYCQGDGFVHSDELTAIKLRGALNRYININPQAQVLLVKVNPSVFGKLFSTKTNDERAYDIDRLRIYLEPDELTHVQNFKIINLGKGIVDLPDMAKLWN